MTNFSVGGLYFWIQYADHERLFLAPESIIFLGKNLERNLTDDLWYFQDVKSYCIYGPETFSEPFDREITEVEFTKISGKTPPTTLITLPKVNLYQVVDCEGLSKAASECATRRDDAGKP